MKQVARTIKKRVVHHLGLGSKVMIGFFIVSVLAVGIVWIVPSAKQEVVSIFEDHDIAKQNRDNVFKSEKKSYKRNPDDWKSNAIEIIGLMNGALILAYNAKNLFTNKSVKE